MTAEITKIPKKKCLAWKHTHKGVIAGKLKGHIPAQTPRGSLMQYVSIPSQALGTNSPICMIAIPQARSTTSREKYRKKINFLQIKVIIETISSHLKKFALRRIRLFS